MLRRVLIAIGAVLILGLLGFSAFAWRPPIKAIDPPSATTFPAALVSQGEQLAGAGYCATCHTAAGGQPYAGGYRMQTPFGAIYSTNITPDPETGIGRWSEAAFRRAMRDGVARNGSHLFPAFPYEHFNKLTDADISALYAYMMTRPPVEAKAKRNGVPFPLNIRALQAGWKLLFFRPKPFTPDPAKSPAWNRGAYLAEGISHCGACHTPRNGLGAEQWDKSYAGALIDGWIAPPLTKANPSPVPWSQEDLFTYLRTGVTRYHGVAVGPMSPVVHDGLARLPDADVQALAIYFGDQGQAAGRSGEIQPALVRASALDQATPGLHYGAEARLYNAACASCHYNGPQGPEPLRPDLALNSAVYLDDPTNLIQVMLHGVAAKEGAPGVVMPGFASMRDVDLARIAAYLRATRTQKPAWPDLEKKVAEVRAQASEGKAQ